MPGGSAARGAHRLPRPACRLRRRDGGRRDGAGDDPQLTVRMVAGASPTRVCSTAPCGCPMTPWCCSTTPRRRSSPPSVRSPRGAAQLRGHWRRRGRRGTRRACRPPRCVGAAPQTASSPARRRRSRRHHRAAADGRVVDRLITSISPLVIGYGTSAVGRSTPSGSLTASRLANRTILPIGDDVLLAWDVVDQPPAT